MHEPDEKILKSVHCSIAPRTPRRALRRLWWQRGPWPTRRLLGRCAGHRQRPLLASTNPRFSGAVRFSGATARFLPRCTQPPYLPCKTLLAGGFGRFWRCSAGILIGLCRGLLRRGWSGCWMSGCWMSGCFGFFLENGCLGVRLFVFCLFLLNGCTAVWILALALLLKNALKTD